MILASKLFYVQQCVFVYLHFYMTTKMFAVVKYRLDIL